MINSDKSLVGAGLVLAMLLGTPAARADADAEQRAVALFEKGRKLAREGRCEDAIPPLLESVRYLEGVGPLLNLGHCYETLGKLASAHRYFVRAQEVATSRGDRRRVEAEQRARAVEKDLSTLVVHIPPSISNADVRVDGEAWPKERWDAPFAIDAGEHTVEVIAPPRTPQTAQITVRRHGDRVEWSATEPAPPPPPAKTLPIFVAPAAAEPRHPAEDEPPSSAQRTLGLVSGGAGLLALGAGAVFGALSYDAHSFVVQRCSSYPRCPSSDRDLLENKNQQAATMGTAATVAVTAGAILLVGGAVLFFTAPKHR